MKTLLQQWRVSIQVFFIEKFLTILDIIDAIYAGRKYVRLFKLTDKLYSQYCDTRNLFFVNGGYQTYKNVITSRAEAILHNAKILKKAFEILNNDWNEYFDDQELKAIEDKIVLLNELQKFGEQNSQKKNT